MIRQNLLVAALVVVSLPAFAKSDKSKVVHKALRESVRVEVLVRGQVARAASGVVVAVEGKTSYVLTNEHVVQREGLKGAASFQVVVERPNVHRLPAHVMAEGRVPDADLALLAVEGEALTPATIASEDQVDIGDDVVVVGAPYGRSLSVSAGIVSQLEVDEQDVQRSMKTDAPIGYGASGGGVFDVPMPGETFLSPPAKIRSFLMQSGVGRLAGLRRGSAMAESPQRTDPVARQQ